MTAERALLKALDGGCATPIGGLCRWSENPRKGEDEKDTGAFTLRGRVIALDGRLVLEDELSGKDPVALGKALAQKLIARGADELVREARGLK